MFIRHWVSQELFVPLLVAMVRLTAWLDPEHTDYSIRIDDEEIGQIGVARYEVRPATQAEIEELDRTQPAEESVQ